MQRPSNYRILWLTLGAYLAVSLWCLRYSLWYVNGPDAFAYIRIAEKLASGTFADAVHGHWSPLISWLLAPLVMLSENGIIAFKVLQLFIGGGVLLAWHALLRTMAVPWRTALLWAAVPMVMAQGLLVLSPDLLFVGLLFVLLMLAVRGGITGSVPKAVHFGLVGAALYLTKQFGLPLFLLLLLVVFLIEHAEGSLPLRVRVGHGLVILGAFLLLSAPWMLILSLKYNKPTIGEASSYNFAPGVIRSEDFKIVHPAFNDGLWEVPPGSLSVWEEPGSTLSTGTQAMTRLSPDLLQRIAFNLRFIYYDQVRRQVGSIFLVLLALGLIVPRMRPLFLDRRILLCGTVMLGLWLGYVPVLVQDRYIWTNGYLMLAVVALLLRELPGRVPILRSVLLCGTLLLAVKRPIKQFFYPGDVNTSVRALVDRLLHPSTSMARNFQWEQELLRVADALKAKGAVGGRYAALPSGPGEREWHVLTMQLAYLLQGTYHGNVPSDISPAEQRAMLRTFDIDFLVVWGNQYCPMGRLVVEETGMRVYAPEW